MRFGSLRPQYCSIYDPCFWWHERYWKLLAPLPGMLNGTPFKSPVWRLAGVRIGRRGLRRRLRHPRADPGDDR